MSSSRVHIALPNSSQFLMDLGMGDLRIGLIDGSFTKTVDTTLPAETRFGVKTTRTVEEHRIKWGSKTLPYDKTVAFEEIYNAEGPFIITRMIVQWPYEKEVVDSYGVPQIIESISLHEFRKWPFKPGLFKKLFDRMPSHPLYELLLREKKKWAKRSGDMESLKRMRDTWLINRPPREVPYRVYKLWYGKGAMILPETVGDFKGRELGTDYMF